MNERIKAVVRAAYALTAEYQTYANGADLVDLLIRLCKECDLLKHQDLAECGVEVGE